MIDNKYDLSEFELLGEYTHPLQVPNRTILGREAVMEQIKAALYRPELSNVMLIAPAGSGKGHTPDTMIAVNDSRGYIRFDELKVGDKVFDENGLPTKVIGVYPQGKKDVYEVTFSDGSKVYCNDEHIWNVRNKWSHRKDKSFTNMTLSEIMQEGVISKEFHSVGNRVCKNTKWYIPMNRAIDRKPIKLHVHPYVLGVLLGDGVLSHPDMNNLVISSNDEWIINKVSELIGADGYTDNNRNYSWYFYSDIKGQGTRTNPKYVKLRDILKGDAKSLIGKKSPERFIPERYFLGSIYQRKALLQGLMDTDGCVTNGFRANCSYSTNSKRLAEDVLRLAQSLGYRGRISSSNRKNSVHNNAEYEVHFSVANDKKCELFTLPRHLEKLEKCLSERDENMAVRRFDDIGIRSIRKLKKKDDIICIYVEGESHLYQVGYEHIVTHNTAVVQGIMLRDKDRIYLEVDLAKMLSELTDKNQMADILKRLFDEAVRYRNTTGKDLVLFIDEFHQIMALSPAAAEALKPILADSGVRGIKVIAATTIEEFTEWIKPNLPLQERLQRINLPPVDKETTIAILRNMAETYGVENQFYNDFMYEKIYEYTNRYIPASVQPRKSIRIFDAMVGWHRSTGRKLNEELLAEVIYESENVKVDFDIDALHIKEELDKKVFAQDFATRTIEERLQICAAGLNNKGKPMSSFLFSGSTGVGKGLTNDTVIPVWTEDGSVHTKLNGELQIGDYVFNRLGKPVKVVGVFPRGVQDIYRVSLSDGREIYTDSSHLWTYLQSKGKATMNTYTNSTKELYDRGVYAESPDGRHKLKYYIPMNNPVEFPEADVSVHPYVMGAFIGDGSLTVKQLTLSSSDEDLVAHVSELLGGCSYKHNQRNFNWTFPLDEPDGLKKSYQMPDVFADYPEVKGKKSHEKRIPSVYMYGSVEQRWELVKGLFDTDGSIGGNDGGRYSVSYSTTSEGLALDIQSLLYSLGVASTITVSRYIEGASNNGNYVQYRVNVKSANDNKERFFWLPRKVEIARKAKEFGSKQTSAKRKDYDWVGISNIELMPYQKETTCIYVDDEEHLYQAGDYIVTHNTETTKQLAVLLFGDDDRRLIRMDMTEYANDDSLERFRKVLTDSVWARPYSIVLFDEVEKACASVTRVLLQVLDDGRLIDSNNREVTFTNAYIVMTTNAGNEIYKTIAQYNVDDEGSGKIMAKYDKLIRRSLSETTGGNRFPPELLGRIDCIVPFQPLSMATQREIVRTKLKELQDRVMRQHGVKMTIQKDVIKYLVEDNLDTQADSGGARIVISKLEKEVISAVSRFLNTYPEIHNIGIKVEGDMMTDNKNQLESTAYIKVVAVNAKDKDKVH